MHRLRNIRLSTKLTLALSLMLGISATIGANSAYDIWNLGRSEQILVSSDAASQRWSASAQEHMTRIHQLVFQINATPFAQSNTLRERLGYEEGGLAADLSRLRAVISPDERALFDRAQAGVRRYRAISDSDMTLVATGRQADAQALLSGEGVHAFDRVDTAFDTLVDKQAGDMSRAALAASNQTHRTLWLVVALSLLGSLGLGGFIIGLARQDIVEPLRKITVALRRLADGRPAEPIPPTDRNDEIGDLTRALEVFRRNALALVEAREEADEQRKLAEAERLSGGFFRSAIESSMDSVRVLDVAGRLMFMNRGGQRAFEIEDLNRYVGQPCRSLWPEPAATQIAIGIEAARHGETHRFEGMCPTERGAERWWDVFIAPVQDDDGALVAIVATSRDVTLAHELRIEAEAREQRLARAAAALGSTSRLAQVGAWEVDFTRDQAHWSDELCALLGVSPPPVMSFAESVGALVEDDRAGFVEAIRQTRETGERLAFEGRTPSGDGAVRWWRLFGEPIFADGQCVGVHGAAQDITAWRHMQERERSAVAAAEAMSAFLATMSHELRTPLNGVLGMAQVLGRSKLTAKQRENLAVIESSGEALLSLLNDLLDLSKIEAGRIELEDGFVDTARLADGARAIGVSLLQGKAVRLEVSLSSGAQGSWRGDPSRVRQILHNLISNAVKFTSHGSIAVDISHEDHRLVFCVRDTGIGIPADKLKTVFDKFVQADATTTRRYGGSGLGLTITRDLVALMGGEISVQSAVGEGTIFTVSLPLPRAEDAPQVEQPSLGEPSPTMRVLAAEDNPVNQVVLKTLLGEVGLAPLVVSNGAEALEAWRREDWDVVLMDIQMPVMDGVSAVKAIRVAEHEQNRQRTPVIAVTANAMAHHRAEYLAAGMDDVVSKPVELGALLYAIEAVLDAADAAKVSASAG